MKKCIIVLTDKYPFGNGETFVETERHFWLQNFDLVIICPVIATEKDELRVTFKKCAKKEIIIHTVDTHPTIVDIIKNINGFYSIIKQSGEIVKWTEFQPSKIKSAIAMAIYSNMRYKRILKKLLSEVGNLSDFHIYVYAYWMFEPELVGAALYKELGASRFISRAHGYDLYEERQPSHYFAFRNCLFNQLDKIYPISKDGEEYLCQKYPQLENKISVARLGTIKLYDSINSQKTINRLVLVSCSNLVPLKRVNRIISALSHVRQPVFWYHFGDGEQRNELETQAKRLPKNIKSCFMGRIPNDQVQKFYAENYIDVFVNVSETEGIPVSIMEAQSYGIPVVATDVGGTHEIIHDGLNGLLLKANFSDSELLSAINTISVNAETFRLESIKAWNQMSNAELNYSRFFEREFRA